MSLHFREAMHRTSSLTMQHHATTDSTVLAHVMCLLNKRYDYGLDLYLLSIDEGDFHDILSTCHPRLIHTVKRNYWISRRLFGGSSISIEAPMRNRLIPGSDGQAESS